MLPHHILTCKMIRSLKLAPHRFQNNLASLMVQLRMTCIKTVVGRTQKYKMNAMENLKRTTSSLIKDAQQETPLD